MLDVGCADGAFLFKYLDYKPQVFCGIEAAPELKKQAEARGIQVRAVDLNGVWPYEDNSFEVIHCAQVIEHLHNTRLFAAEILRVLKPGGSAFITSENLTSFLNTGAMMMGYTPFTLMRCCGWYMGNPMGLHSGGGTPNVAGAIGFAVTTGCMTLPMRFATLVATRGPHPSPAIALSALFNMLGALVIGTAVASTSR